MLELVIAMPSGERQPVDLPLDAPSGRVAEKAARTLGIQSQQSGTWVFVREATGETIHPDRPLGDLALVRDEVLRLGTLTPEAQAATLQSMPAIPAALSYPTPLPMPAQPAPPTLPSIAHLKAGAAGKGRPGATEWTAPVIPVPAAAASAGAGPWAPPGPPVAAPAGTMQVASRRTAALVAGGVSVLVVAAVGVTLLVTGGSDPVPVTTATVGGVASAAPVPSAGGDEGATPAPATGSTDLGETPLDPSPGVASYEVSLPRGWSAQLLDEAQVAPAGITRTRTKLVAPTGGSSLIIDSLVGFDKTASENRSSLDRTYSTSQPGYRRLGFESVALPDTVAYEWRYEMDNDSGRLVHKSNVMFDLGGHLFAVLVTARLDEPMADLSRLARTVARTIRTS